MMRLTDDGKDGAALLTRAASLTRMGLVRCLKGAASSVLWALLLEGRPMTAGQLQEATGYSDKPVRQALARLRALGLVAHHGRYQGWSLSKRMRDGGFAPPSPGQTAGGGGERAAVGDPAPRDRPGEDRAADADAGADAALEESPSITRHNISTGAARDGDGGAGAAEAAEEKDTQGEKSAADTQHNISTGDGKAGDAAGGEEEKDGSAAEMAGRAGKTAADVGWRRSDCFRPGRSVVQRCATTGRVCN